MHRKFTLALVVLLALATVAFAAETEKITLKIQGMDCGKCASKIETELKKVNGVKDADVSLLRETAEVEMTKGVTMASLTEAVNKAGYAVAGQKNFVAHNHKQDDPDCGKKCPMEKHKEQG